VRNKLEIKKDEVSTMADAPDGDQSSAATEEFENLSLIDLNENDD